MSDIDQIQRLKDEIKRLKSEVAASKKFQKKKDRLKLDYKNSQTRFKTVFEKSSLGKKFINADLKIIKANKALVHLLGYSKRELIGSCITDIAHPSFGEGWKKLQHELWVLQRPSFSIDTCIRKKNNSLFGVM